MKFVSRKTVVTYRYEDELEMERHIREMQREGWIMESSHKHSFFMSKLHRSYSKIIPQGAFL